MPVWVAVSRGASAVGKGAAKGASAVGKGAAKGAARVGRAAGKGAGKGAQAGARGATKGAQKAGQAGARAGKGGLDARTAAQVRKAARNGKGKGDGKLGASGGGGGAGRGSGRGPLGRGGAKGWARRAKDAAGRGGAGGGAIPGVDGGATDGSDAATEAAAASEAARNFIRNRWRKRRGPLKKTRTRLNRICLGILGLLLVLPLLMGLYGADATGQQTEAVMAMQCSGAPFDLMSEQTGIPIDAVAAYCSAAVSRQIDWAVLAGIGKKECDHWRNRSAAGCNPGPPRTVNSAGARGPMQFLGSTWRSSAGTHDLDVAGNPIPDGEESAGYATDGDDDGIADPWSWRDATHAAARYLLAHGFAENQHDAIYAYNRSQEYVQDVLDLAQEYRSKVERVMDDEGTGGGGGLGDLAIGDCPWTAEGSTVPVPPSRNTEATQQMANTLIACFGRNGHAVGCWAERPGDKFEHPRGRACDFMMTAGAGAGGHDRERGQAMAEWAQAHAEELNILYVIWYNRIWSRARDPMRAVPWSEWRDYGCGGCGPSPGHYNHVHVSVKLMPGDPPNARCTHSSCTN